MKTFATTLTLLALLFIGGSYANAQSFSNADLQQLREERSITLFNLQNKSDIAKEKAMGETYTMNVENADLDNKRNEVEIVKDASFPKFAETNNPQKGAWEYAQAKQAWVDAHPEQYAAMMNTPVSNQ